MYLSHLLIDVGSNPDRPRPGRFWLRNAYHVHQRLCMAFPSKDRGKKEQDPEFLQPYKPEDFSEVRHIAHRKASDVGSEELAHVHTPRNSDSGFLFRVDALPGASAVILVLSAIEPDWDYAFHNADYLLAAPPSKPRRMEVAVSPGAQFRFSLKANPVRKKATIPKRLRDTLNQEKPHGKRVPVSPESFGKWLMTQGLKHGFRLVEPTSETHRRQAGYVYFNKKRESGGGQRLRSVCYNGLLDVVDVEQFRRALLSGIGPAKAFGFGLLSVTPVRPEAT